MKNLQIHLFLFLVLAIYSSASGQWVKTGNVGDPGDMVVYSFAAHNGNLFAGTYEGVYYTTDQGSKWIYTGLTHSNIYSLLSSGKYLFAGIARYGDTDSLSDIFVSSDNGESWKSASAGLMQRDTIMTLCQLNTSLYAGTLHGIFRSDDNGKNWEVSGLQDRTVYALAHDGKNLYAGTYFGVIAVPILAPNGFIPIATWKIMCDAWL